MTQTEGLTSHFLECLRKRIQIIAVEKAYPYYVQLGWDTFRNRHAQLREVEKIVTFFDYNACVLSPLSAAASTGSSRAEAVIAQIFSNAQHYLATKRKQAFNLPLRRLPIHMVTAFRNLQHVLSKREKKVWNKLIYKNAKLLLRYVKKFRPDVSAPCNGTLNTGLNHYCIVCEAIWLLGNHFTKPKWMSLAVDFSNRVLAFAPQDGYFEENTNLDHEGGPSLRYTPLSSGAMYHVQLWNNTLDEERFKVCDAFQRNMVDPDLNVLCFADERSNDRQIRPFGLALHSLTPEGRQYLRAVMDSGAPLDPDTVDLQKLGRLYFELETMQRGPGRLSAPFTDGSYTLSVPLGVKRQHGWTAALSALKCLNREIVPNNPYALDRQNLLFLSHKRAGVILRGYKSKGDFAWSTVTRHDDAYPIKTGSLHVDESELSGTAIYSTFKVRIEWTFDKAISLLLTSQSSGLILQLPLELTYNNTMRINQGQSILLGDDSLQIDGVRTIENDKWQLKCEHDGTLIWPVSPFNPYNTGHKSSKEDQRAIFAVTWTAQVKITFESMP